MSEVEHLAKPDGSGSPRCGVLREGDVIVEAFTMDPGFGRCPECIEIFEFRVAEKFPFADFAGLANPMVAGAEHAFFCEGYGGSGYWFEVDVFARAVLDLHTRGWCDTDPPTRDAFFEALPGYVWMTSMQSGVFGSVAMAATAAREAIENACFELHEGAFDEVSREDIADLTERILAWDRERAQKVRTYNRDAKRAIILGPTFWDRYIDGVLPGWPAITFKPQESETTTP